MLVDMGSGVIDWSIDVIVVNILCLLQIFDSDGNLDNGIIIIEVIYIQFQDIVIDFILSEVDFEIQVNLVIGKNLIDKIVVVEYFKSFQVGDLIGSWVYEEDNGNINVLLFFNGDEYLIVYFQVDDD